MSALQEGTGILSSALGGVAGGAALGPIGMVAGGILGLATGLFQNKARKEQEAAEKEQRFQQMVASKPIVAASSANAAQYGRPTQLSDKFGILDKLQTA